MTDTPDSGTCGDGDGEVGGPGEVNGPGAAAPVVDAAEPANRYSSTVEFVEDFLTVVYARPVASMDKRFRWCATWWEHPEAVARLESLWKAFEAQRQDPGVGAAVWWLHYADPTMAALCAPTGPFVRCSGTSHEAPPPLPLADYPDWLT